MAEQPGGNINGAATATEETAGSELLDNLLLRVSIALGARMFTLEELARLRPGQVIELGVTTDEPVDLLVEQRRIARGRLIEIEGRLGLRITNLYR